MKTYAVYVSDSNGWSDGCPDSEEVFFGAHGGTFFRRAYLLPEEFDSNVDLGADGFVLVTGYRAALALRNKLDSTGDWVAAAEVNGEESRPSYAIREMTA